MKRFRLLTFVVSLLLISAIAPAVGFDKKKKAKPPEHHETVIASVTPSAVTITEDKTTKTFAITQFTEISVNGRKSTAADLKPGMLVSVTLTDPTRASRITATDKK
jgi:hypothetical protein